MLDVAKIDDGHVVFWCEGCQRNHYVSIGGNPQIAWDFNNSLEKPTLTPSVKFWHENYCCHFFIRDGKIEFCGDCTHQHAGQTLEMKLLLEIGVNP